MASLRPLDRRVLTASEFSALCRRESPRCSICGGILCPVRYTGARPFPFSNCQSRLKRKRKPSSAGRGPSCRHVGSLSWWFRRLTGELSGVRVGHYSDRGGSAAVARVYPVASRELQALQFLADRKPGWGGDAHVNLARKRRTPAPD